MFEKFGSFETAEEMNGLAENLANEGDEESLRAFAEENGISDDLVTMYVMGDTMEFCDPMTAAMGKIDIEYADLKMKPGIMDDWTEYLRGLVIEDEQMARAVRLSKYSLKGMLGELLKWSFKNQNKVPKEIMKAAGVNAGRCTLGIPGMAQAKRIIREYYGG